MKRAAAVLAGIVLVSCTEAALPPTSPMFREVRAPRSDIVASYTAIDLGSLGGAFGQAVAINDASQVAGYSAKSPFAWSVYRWQSGVMTELPLLGGNYAYSFSINGAGDIAGWATLPGDGTYHATLWVGRAITDLGTLKGDAGSYAADVNNRGQVAGVSWGAINRAFIWQGGAMTELPGIPGANNNHVEDMNDRGDVVGSSREQAVVWRGGGAAIALKRLPGTTRAGAIQINEAGQIAGYSDAGSWYHAVRWDDGIPTDLGDLGGGTSYAIGMNESGDVVGWSTIPGGNVHAFLWRNGVMMDLGDLGSPYSQAVDVNDRGQVTGVAALADGRIHPFLWDNGVMTDLGTLGGVNGSPAVNRSINNRGQVVGSSIGTDLQEHPTLWDPSAEKAVTIDIKPGSTPNSVNPKNKGVIAVAVLSVGGFDATTIDASTVKFGPGNAAESHGKGHVEDANGDGVPDMVLHFDTQASGIACGATSATLTGKTLAGQAIKGSDTVVTVGCK